MRTILLVLAASIAFASTTSAQNENYDLRYEEAVGYLLNEDTQNRQKGLGTIEDLANAGHEKSAAAYAEILRDGRFVDPDTVLSYKYEKIAADKGNTASMHNLGVYLRDGLSGQKPDTISAIGWFRRAAEKDYAPAQWQLSRYYHETGNAEEARYWLKRGADNGDALCNHGLGLAYKNGDDGFPADEDMALNIFKYGAEKYKFLESIHEAAKIYKSHNDRISHLRMRCMYGIGAELNDPECMLHYGESFINDRDEIVFEYYQKICDMTLETFNNDNIWVAYYAFTRRALCYYLGKGCEQNRCEGANMLYYMADKGVPTAIDYIRELNIPRP